MNKIAYKVLFLSALCMSFPSYATPSLSSSEANAVLKQAKALHQEAIAKEGGWKITEKYFKKVKKLLAKGKRKEAFDVANLSQCPRCY